MDGIGIDTVFFLSNASCRGNKIMLVDVVPMASMSKNPPNLRAGVTPGLVYLCRDMDVSAGHFDAASKKISNNGRT